MGWERCEVGPDAVAPALSPHVGADLEASPTSELQEPCLEDSQESFLAAMERFIGRWLDEEGELWVRLGGVRPWGALRPTKARALGSLGEAGEGFAQSSA